MSDDTKPKPLTRAQRKLVDASVLIFGEGATKKDAAFMARELVQASLPHKNPGAVPVWQRSNGNTTLVIQPGWNSDENKSYGYPYGSIPRLLIFWITTEALRNRHKENPYRIDLGPSLTGFMSDLGLNPDNGGTGAKRSDARRLQNQMHRFFNASFSFQGSAGKVGRTVTARLNMHVARKTVFWWNPRQPDRINLWGGFIELSQDFYEAITAAPVPMDKRALKALKRSPLALDLYSWLTYEAYRAHKSGKPRYETWEQLHAHMGGEYADIDNFRKKAKAALTKIRILYPSLKLGRRQGGIEILPESYPPLQPRNMTIDGTCTSL